MYKQFGNPPPFGEVVDDKTLVTVPDQSLTVRQILDRYSKGLPIEGVQPFHFDDNPDFDSDDVTMQRDYDLVDAHNDLQLSQDNINSAREEAKQKRVALEKKASEVIKAKEGSEADDLKPKDEATT